jgi:nitrate reductase molybdenum cofactor assembly chaperone NarJ/NarW
MDRTLKALSLTLSYPTADLQAAMPEIRAVLATDPRLSAPTRQALHRLTQDLGQGDLFDVQEAYVMLFDRSRTLSLNLFEHVHGESRDRGGAMVSLIETYRAAGFEPATTELPDHLPVLLEFLSTRPFAEAQETLADAAHIFDAIATRLVRRDSRYDAAFAALSQLANVQVDADALAGMLAQPDDDPTDLQALDAVWEETEVTFGPDPNAGCPQVRDMLALMDQPAPQQRSA